MANKYTVGIVGGGAVGLAYACFLADGADVILKVRRQEQADSINNHGINLVRSAGNKTITNLKATAKADDIQKCDAIIIAVKSYDTKKIAQEITPFIKPAAQIISLQNGTEAVEVLKATMPHPERVFAAVTYMGGRRTDDYSVQLGKFHRTVADPDATILIAALQATEYGVEISSNIKQSVWDKLVMNTGQNALSAVTNSSAKQMLASEYCLNVASKLLDEFKQVAEAEGLTFTNNLLEKLKANWNNGDDFYPSMWQDLHNGRRTEIDAINGAIVKLAAKHNIPTPHNSMITNLIKALENNQK